MNTASFQKLTLNTTNPNIADLSQEDLKALIYGACFFASGGGGPISMALQFLEKIKKSVPLIPVKELKHNKKVVIVADMGSPDTAAQGRGYTAPYNAYQSLRSYIKETEKKDIAYFIPAEIGAVNTLIPFYISSLLDDPIPVIDADPSGRAVPQLNESLLDVSGQAICPAIIASDTQEDSNNLCSWTNKSYSSQLFLDLTATELEEAARAVVNQPEYQQVGGMACYPMNSETLAGPHTDSMVINHSVSTAVELGKTLLKFGNQQTLAETLTQMDIANYIFIHGKIVGIENKTSSGFDVGKITLQHSKGELWVYYKNESLLAWNPKMNKAMAIAPDCINLVLSQDNGSFRAGTPLSTADIKEGDDCTVWGTACATAMRSPKIEALFQQDIKQILAAFPDDNIIIKRYISLQELNG